MTFADDTAILARGHSVAEATVILQAATDWVYTWTKKWRMKLNESKSIHINFTNRKTNPVPVTINLQPVSYENTPKYLGMTLDVKLWWKEHIKKKKKELNIKYSTMYFGFSEDTLSCPCCPKTILYKANLKPI